VQVTLLFQGESVLQTLSISLWLRTAFAGLLLTSGVFAAQIQVTITNLAPQGGTFLTPVWVGFHDGSFDIYDSGSPASAALERVAEDGDTGPITTAFTASGAGAAQGTLGGGPIAPGQTVSFLFNLDGLAANSRFFSYVSMVIPSNDAFIANGNPQAFPIFDAGGNFLGANFTVLGSMVLDAGTEDNDELAANTAFFGQAAPNTGVTSGGVVGLHPGFIPGGPILSSAMFPNADFLAGGYQVAQFSISEVPEPGTLLSGGAGLLLVLFTAWRRKTA
jgi:hypothetical protein